MENKLTSLIAGPTDRTKIFRFTHISESKYPAYLDNLAGTLVKYVSHVNIIPDQGVPLDLAKRFRTFGGQVIGYVPKGGCDLFKSNFDSCDSIQEFEGGWSALNTCLSLKGDIITVVGMSPGTIVEIAYTKYHAKYLGKKLPILIDQQLTFGQIPDSIAEELDLRGFGSLTRLEQLLKHIQDSKK